MSSTLRIAVAQLRGVDCKKTNFSVCEKLCERAQSEGAQMLFFPENFAFIGSPSKKAIDNSEYLTGELFTSYRGLAEKYNLFLSLGGFHEKIQSSENKMYNSHVIVDPKGQMEAVYRKIHLFEYQQYHESLTTNSGTSLVSWKMPDTPFVFGLSICYDIRFPELYLNLCGRKFGYSNVLLIPSCFTVPTGKAHWKQLNQARAIENQCYVISAAQSGQHNENRISYGHSLVVDPFGKTLLDLDTKENDIGVVDISIDELTNIRSKMQMNHILNADFNNL